MIAHVFNGQANDLSQTEITLAGSDDHHFGAEGFRLLHHRGNIRPQPVVAAPDLTEVAATGAIKRQAVTAQRGFEAVPRAVGDERGGPTLGNGLHTQSPYP
mgnify:CR=1 FL=1